MLKEILLVLSLISLSSSTTYSPWHLRNFDYSVSDIFSYTYDNFRYVKPCQANYKCQIIGGDSHSIETCRQVYKTVKIYGEACSGDIECDSGLKCEGSKCINTNDGGVYKIEDRIQLIMYIIAIRIENLLIVMEVLYVLKLLILFLLIWMVFAISPGLMKVTKEKFHPLSTKFVEKIHWLNIPQLLTTT